MSAAVASAARKARAAASKLTVAESQLLLKKLARDLKAPAPGGANGSKAQQNQQNLGNSSQEEAIRNARSSSEVAAPSSLSSLLSSAQPQSPLNAKATFSTTTMNGNHNYHQVRYPPLASDADGTFWGRRDALPPARDPHDPYGLLGANTAAAAHFFDDLQEPPVHM